MGLSKDEKSILLVTLADLVPLLPDCNSWYTNPSLLDLVRVLLIKHLLDLQQPLIIEMPSAGENP